VKIGKGTVIENFIEIMTGTIIGEDCKIRSFSRIGDANRIGNNVVIKCSAITGPNTTIQDYAFIGPQVIALSDLQSGTTNTVIGRHAFVGAGCRILPGIFIGNRAYVGAMSLVNRDIPKDEMWYGIPCRRVDISPLKDR
jgi:UDP-N-acetylglucosamine acyltransferase